MIKKYLIVIVIIFIFFINGCSDSSSGIKNYLNSGGEIDLNSKDIMPSLEDLPEYEKIEYKDTYKSILFFESHSVALIVEYDDNTFESEKKKLDEKYTFLNEKIKSDFDKNKYYIPEYEFSIESYTFRVVDKNNTSNTKFPKSFGMVGISEEKKSIAYLYFYDEDLDYIGEENEENPMVNFLNKYFKYKF